MSRNSPSRGVLAERAVRTTNSAVLMAVTIGGSAEPDRRRAIPAINNQCVNIGHVNLDRCLDSALGEQTYEIGLLF